MARSHPKTMKKSNRDSSGPGLAARATAVDAIIQVISSRATLEDVFERVQQSHPQNDRDAALARAIATVTLRRYGSLRHALRSRFDKENVALPRLDAILATGAAQILHMDVPDHAAVDIAVRLTQQDGSLRGFSGLVNAILRRIIREREIVAEQDDPLQDVPQWLLERWMPVYGEERVRAIAAAHRAGASVDVTVTGNRDDWGEALNADRLTTGSLRLRDRVPITELSGFADGAWWIQDAAAALPVRLLAPQQGEKIADLCAAPGGKTAQIAACGAQVLAVDRSAQRLKRLRENMQRLNFTVDVRVSDVLTLKEGGFDAILLDAPCSATGTMRRHPEIAWTKSNEDISKLADLQHRLLDKTLELLAPGGRMVYCTCSLEPEEGENQIQAFLARHPNCHRLPIQPEEIGLPALVTATGDLRSLPFMEAGPGFPGMDGFFAARLRKT